MTAALFSFPWVPERASDLAGSVDAIFYTLLVFCGLLIFAVAGLVLFFCVHYRQGAPASRHGAQPRSFWVEVTWSSLTLVAFVGIFIWAAAVFFHMSQPPEDATEIHVVAKQWMWKAQHGDGRREINELHLLVGQPVKLVMTSQDVIHDFFVPAFRTKQDVLPGRYTQEWFTPTRPGQYHLFCAEYCGAEHSLMGGSVFVQEPAEYARWRAEQPAGDTIVQTGAKLFVARGCTGCHGPNSAVRAPRLEGIYRKPVALADQSVVIADDQYLHDSIVQPAQQITAGYENLMPSYQGQLSEEELMALVAYLKSRSLTDQP